MFDLFNHLYMSAIISERVITTFVVITTFAGKLFNLVVIRIITTVAGYKFLLLYQEIYFILSARSHLNLIINNSLFTKI